MITIKELIKSNNEKRELLTEENEKYYSNLLVYIRSRLSLSDRSTEEVLMELLDHTLEGQVEGKTAEKIFGEDPKSFADELIQQMPKESKREILQFGAQLVTNVLGLLLIIRGLVILIISQFKEVENSVYLYSSAALFSTVLIAMAFGIWLIFKAINKTVFGKNKKVWRIELVGGLAGAALAASVMAVSYFYKEQGPAIPFPWYWSIFIGLFIWLISRVIKRKVDAN